MWGTYLGIALHPVEKALERLGYKCNCGFRKKVLDHAGAMFGVYRQCYGLFRALIFLPRILRDAKEYYDKPR